MHVQSVCGVMLPQSSWLLKLPNVVVSLRCFAGDAKQICQNDKTERTRGRAMRAETVVSSLNKQISDVLVSVVIA